MCQVRPKTKLILKKRLIVCGSEKCSKCVRHYSIPEKLVRLMENFHNKSLSAVHVDSELTN